ncbi:short-chain dehydrogenase [Pelagivirga sediminicola]|uniref:Short-chain dehydrogenase n=1 Tax=Pelagivirga sediminicola TaxID=2170575 RepID=A0A2T7G5B1_9RHOB|nr:SDR family oxidoreductase [Pelagivirga sediminicola]PVA09612.1 short-chain dehydrogenase [Pelagivirga sediminicola]
MNMTGKSVLITGASQGIGAATARLFAEAGARLVLMARGRGPLEALAQELGAIAHAGDVAQIEDLNAAVARAQEHHGGLDVLIGNAGIIGPMAPLATSDPGEWAGTININTTGVYNGMRAAMPVMQAAGGGTILTVSSGAAHRPVEGWSAYCASKAGAAMLTASADLEGRADGLRVMGLSPGTVATDMQRDIKASGVSPVSRLDWSEHIPPEWPARALLWMCSDKADAHLGREISLRDPDIRAAIGLEAGA